MDAEKGEEFTVSHVRNEDDFARFAALKDALESMVGARIAVVDAWGVTYFERLGVYELLNVYKVIRRINDVARPRLVVPTALVRRALEDSGIGKLFDVYDNLDTAMRAVESHN